jgi:hypothetical protein
VRRHERTFLGPNLRLMILLVVTTATMLCWVKLLNIIPLPSNLVLRSIVVYGPPFVAAMLILTAITNYFGLPSLPIAFD